MTTTSPIMVLPSGSDLSMESAPSSACLQDSLFCQSLGLEINAAESQSGISAPAETLALKSNGRSFKRIVAEEDELAMMLALLLTPALTEHAPLASVGTLGQCPPGGEGRDGNTTMGAAMSPQPFAPSTAETAKSDAEAASPTLLPDSASVGAELVPTTGQRQDLSSSGKDLPVLPLETAGGIPSLPASPAGQASVPAARLPAREGSNPIPWLAAGAQGVRAAAPEGATASPTPVTRVGEPREQHLSDSPAASQEAQAASLVAVVVKTQEPKELASEGWAGIRDEISVSAVRDPVPETVSLSGMQPPKHDAGGILELSTVITIDPAPGFNADVPGVVTALAVEAKESVGEPGYTNATAVSATSDRISISVPMGQPDWGKALGQQVLMVAQGHGQRAELHLQPPELGALDVRIAVVNDQTEVSFASPHVYVCDAIESAAPKLRQMFADAGLSLASVNVSLDTSSQHQGYRQGGHIPGPDFLPNRLLSDQTSTTGPGLPVDLPLPGRIDYYA